MANPDLILIPFAQDGDKNTIPLELGIGDPVYRASLKAGFPPDTRIPKDIGGEPPDGLDFNGILNVLSQAIVFMQKGNAYQFDSNLAPYPIGALVRSNDDLTTFQSTIALNSNNPNSNMTGWRVYNGSGFIVDNLTTNDSAKALSAAQGKVLGDRDFGVGQAWQDVTSSRFSGVTYTNNTSKPIQISIVIRDSGVVSPISLNISGVLVFSISDFNVAQYISLDKIIPAGAAYTLNAGNNPIVTWSELR